MAVLIRHRAEGMTPGQYDEISPPLIEQLKKAPGFKLHVSFVDDAGFCVAEIWETKEEHDAFFDGTVASNVPVPIAQEVIELHSVHRP